MRRLDRALAQAEDGATLIAAFAIFALMLPGMAQILPRTLLDAPISGYIDFVELSMATMAFLGAAYCRRLGSHVRMELLVGRLHGRMLWLVEAFGILVALAVIGVLIWYSAQHFMRAYTLGDTTIDARFPVWPSKLLVPIAFSVWFLRLLIQFAGSVRLLIDPARERIGVVTAREVMEQAREEIEEIMGEAPGEGDGRR